MPRVTGSLVVGLNSSAAKFVSNDPNWDIVLPWKMLNNWDAIKDFVESFKLDPVEQNRSMTIYDVDCDSQELVDWFDSRKKGTQ